MKKSTVQFRTYDAFNNLIKLVHTEYLDDGKTKSTGNITEETTKYDGNNHKIESKFTKFSNDGSPAETHTEYRKYDDNQNLVEILTESERLDN